MAGWWVEKTSNTTVDCTSYTTFTNKQIYTYKLNKIQVTQLTIQQNKNSIIPSSLGSKDTIGSCLHLLPTANTEVYNMYKITIGTSYVPNYVKEITSLKI